MEFLQPSSLIQRAVVGGRGIPKAKANQTKPKQKYHRQQTTKQKTDKKQPFPTRY